MKFTKVNIIKVVIRPFQTMASREDVEEKAKIQGLVEDHKDLRNK